MNVYLKNRKNEKKKLTDIDTKFLYVNGYLHT